MGVKQPTSGGIISTTGTKTGLNKIVSYIGGRFDTYFNDTAYPDTVYPVQSGEKIKSIILNYY